MENIPKKKVIAGVILVLVFIVGFFSGREYMKYEIRSALSDGFKEAFGGGEKKSSNTTTFITKEEKKPIKNIKSGESYIFEKEEGEKIAIKVKEIKEYGKEYKEDDWSKIEGNNLVVIRLESENVGKKQTFKSISEYNIKLITSEGMEFGAKTVQQNHNVEGFGGCISCKNNPGEKNVQDIIFDIDTEKVKGARIILDEDDNVAFEL